MVSGQQSVVRTGSPDGRPIVGLEFGGALKWRNEQQRDGVWAVYGEPENTPAVRSFRFREIEHDLARFYARQSIPPDLE